MKRIFTFIAAFSTVMAALAQTQGITVSHPTTDADGNTTEVLTFYSSDKFADAVRDAKPYDIIYLSSGTYSYNNLPEGNYYLDNPTSSSTTTCRFIDKPLTFIGAGAQVSIEIDTNNDGTNDKKIPQGSFLSGSYPLVIDLSAYSDGDRNISFEGIRFNSGSGLYFSSQMKDVLFRNVSIPSTTLGFIGNHNHEVLADYKVDNLLIDRSEIRTVQLGSGVIGIANIYNTKLGSSSSSTYEGIFGSGINPCVLNHCYISHIDSSFKGMIDNSIVYNADYISSEVVVKNSAFTTSWVAGSYTVDPTCKLISSSSYTYSYDNDPSSMLVATGYENCKDSEGNPWGTGGIFNTDILKADITNVASGTYPNVIYGLFPSYPTPDVDNSKVTVDWDASGTTKQMNVTISILGE